MFNYFFLLNSYDNDFFTSNYNPRGILSRVTKKMHAQLYLLYIKLKFKPPCKYKIIKINQFMLQLFTVF